MHLVIKKLKKCSRILPENVNSLGRNAIKVIGNTQTIEHIPEKLAQKLAPLMREC